GREDGALRGADVRERDARGQGPAGGVEAAVAGAAHQGVGVGSRDQVRVAKRDQAQVEAGGGGLALTRAAPEPHRLRGVAGAAEARVVARAQSRAGAAVAPLAGLAQELGRARGVLRWALALERIGEDVAADGGVAVAGLVRELQRAPLVLRDV